MRIPTLAVALLIAAAPARAQAGPDSAGVYELHQVEVLPRPQNAAEYTAALRQVYPPQLLEAGVGGTVQMSFVVGVDGWVGDVRVLSASDSAFAAPGMQAVSVLRFAPAQVGGRPVAVRVEQPITWRVEAPPAPAPEAVATVRLPDSVTVLSLDSVDVRPLPLNFKEFEASLRALYPAELRSSGTTAQVLAGFVVDFSGKPVYAQVLESTDRRFDAATLEAVGGLRFQPARLNGQPVSVWMEVPVEWAEPAVAGQGAVADSASAYELEAVTTPPRPRNGRAFGHTLARLYPPELRDAGRSGEVMVRFIVEPDGRTSHAHVIRSTNRSFDLPTLEALRTMRYDPARLGDQPVRVWVQLPISWRVEARSHSIVPVTQP